MQINGVFYISLRSPSFSYSRFYFFREARRYAAIARICRLDVEKYTTSRLRQVAPPAGGGGCATKRLAHETPQSICSYSVQFL